MIISEARNSLEDKNEIIDLSIIKKLLEMLSVLLIIFTVFYFTCFGCFLVFNGSTSWIAQIVTLSSERAANQSSMGQYQLAEVTSDTDFNWYRHVDRNRFLVYNNFGNN